MPPLSQPLRHQPDVVHLDGRPVVLGRRHRHLELARQEAELGMQRRPLADDLGVGPGVHHLLGRGAGEMIGGDVADAVAAGLDGVHLHLGQLREDGRNVLEARPVELQVLARREMSVAPVIAPCDVRELAHLARGERAVGDGDAQHVGVQLEVDAVAQAQRLELVLGQLARQAAGDLVGELRDALAHEFSVEFVIAVHLTLPPSRDGIPSPRFSRGEG